MSGNATYRDLPTVGNDSILKRVNIRRYPEGQSDGTYRGQMKYVSSRFLAVMSLTSLLILSMSVLAKDEPIRTVVYLVLINVFAESRETHAPVRDLSSRDFQIVDNGTILEPSVFNSDSSEPIAMWFLAGCPQHGDGSDLTAWDANALRQALNNLDNASSVGVAHWCANGDAGADLLPTQDREAPLAPLEAILRQKPVESSDSSNKRALQRALELVIEKSRDQNHEVLPVIVLLTDGRLSISKNDADLMAKRLLYHRAILFDLENRHDDSDGVQRKEEFLTTQFISRQTGGRMYAVRHGDYHNVVNHIISALRFRYTLGVSPRPDGQWHELRVQLPQAALRKREPVQLDYPAGYLAVGSFGTPPYSIRNYRRLTNANLDNVLAEVLDGRSAVQNILFQVNGHGFVGSDSLAEFSLRVNSDQLTWEKLPNGDRRSEMSIVVAGYSEEGQELGHMMIVYEIVRDEINLPITGDGPFSSSETVILPEHSSRVRVVLRDNAAGKIGYQDLSLKEILSAPRTPRSPMVIR
jgi:hypothetical protein